MFLGPVRVRVYSNNIFETANRTCCRAVFRKALSVVFFPPPPPRTRPHTLSTNATLRNGQTTQYSIVVEYYIVIPTVLLPRVYIHYDIYSPNIYTDKNIQIREKNVKISKFNFNSGPVVITPDNISYCGRQSR